MAITSKINSSFNQDPNPNNTEDGNQANAEEDISSIIKDIPKSEEEKAAAHDRIRNSMYALRVLYREKIESYSKTIVEDNASTGYEMKEPCKGGLQIMEDKTNRILIY